MPDLVKLGLILALIIGLLRLKWHLGVVLLLASALTGLLFGRAAVDLLGDALRAAADPLTLRLVGIVLLIALLGEILRSTLQLEGMIQSLMALIADRRWLLALLPLLIGMLPMAGGAMFSAPMVEEAGRGLDVGRERETFINYWFRHALEPVFPLYPGLILAAGLLGVSPQRLTLTQWPLFVAAVVGGTAFGLAGLGSGRQTGGGPASHRQTWLLLAKSTWPLLLVLGLSLIVGMDLLLALAATIVVLIAAHRLGPRRLMALARRVPLGPVPIIIGAMIFRQVLASSGAIEAVAAELAALHVPVSLVVFGAPFTAGLLTGLLAAALAIGFPIGLPLAAGDPVGTGFAALAFAGGLIGMLLSPMHLCLSLTREYYKAEWGGIYRRVVPAAGLLVIAVTAIVLVK
jgi:hypothetical protein